MADPEQRTALVIGASRGLGLGLAAELVRHGWDVTGTVRDDAGAARLASAGARVELLDITHPDSIAALVYRVAGRTFDLVFVNAGIGIGPDQVAGTASSDVVAQLFAVNAIAPIAVARALIDRVRDGTGVVGFMSSDLGTVARNDDGFLELYRASKAALNSLIRSFTAGLGHRKITVLAMHPGWVRTDMGGPHAPLAVEDSVPGLVRVLEARAGSNRHGFVDYTGAELDW